MKFRLACISNIICIRSIELLDIVSEILQITSYKLLLSCDINLIS